MKKGNFTNDILIRRNRGKNDDDDDDENEYAFGFCEIFV